MPMPRVSVSTVIIVLCLVVSTFIAFFWFPGTRFGSATRQPESQTREVEIHGLVVDQRKQPIANAELWLANRVEWNHYPVVARGLANANGRFSLIAIFPDSERRETQNYLFAYHPQFGIGVQQFDQEFSDHPIQIKIRKDLASNLTVHDPAGNPLVGAQVKATYATISGQSVTIPADIQQATKCVTDDAGQVELRGVHPNQYSSFEINSKRFGRQMVHLGRNDRRDTPLKLGNTGKLEGQIELPEGVKISELAQKLVVVSNWQPAIDHTPNWTGIAEIKPDEQGRFSIDPIREGSFKIVVQQHNNSHLIAAPPEDMQVAAGATTRIVIPLINAIKVSGRCIDRETRKPIPAVRLCFPFHGFNSETCVTNDNDGSFEINVAPGTKGTIRLIPPAPYSTGGDGWGTIELDVPSQGKSFVLGQLSFQLGRDVQGTVRDAYGKLSAGVNIVASWMADDDSNRRVRTRSGEQGNFKLIGLPRDRDVTIDASVSGVLLASATHAADDNPNSLELKLRSLDEAVVTGRVVQSNGEPASRLKIKIIQYIRNPNGISFSTVETCTTNWNGLFTSKKRVPKSAELSLEVFDGKKRLARSSQQIVSEPHGPIRFAPIQLAIPISQTAKLEAAGAHNKVVAKPLPAFVAGEVVDRAGRPVSNAMVTVWRSGKRMRQQTGTDGQFKFAPVNSSVAWTFVDAEGFHMHGLFGKPSPELKISLYRLDDREYQPLRPRVDSGLSSKQLAFVKSEIRRFGEVVMDASEPYHKMELTRMLTAFDTDYAIALADDPRFDAEELNWGDASIDHNQWHRDFIYIFAARNLAARDFKRARELAEQIADPSHFAWEMIYKHHPGDSEEERLQILVKTEQRVKSGRPSAEQAINLARLARCWYEIGWTDQSTELFNDARQVLSKIDDSEVKNYGVGVVAGELAKCFPAQGLKLLRKLDKSSISQNARYIGNFARQIAAANPQLAAELSSEMPKPGRQIVAICHEMAKSDYSLALQVANKINDPVVRAYAIGMIAASINDKEPLVAEDLIELAYSSLEELVNTGYKTSRGLHHAFPTSVALLIEAETVCPDRIGDYFWRSLSLRQNISFGSGTRVLGPYGEGNAWRISDPILAAFVSRYDVDAARSILLPQDDEEIRLGVISPSANATFFQGLAVIDPIDAVKQVVELPEATQKDRSIKLQALNRLINVVSRSDRDRWNWLRKSCYYLWSPGDSDFE